jgi:hypothetical protein
MSAKRTTKAKKGVDTERWSRLEDERRLGKCPWEHIRTASHEEPSRGTVACPRTGCNWHLVRLHGAGITGADRRPVYFGCGKCKRVWSNAGEPLPAAVARRFWERRPPAPFPAAAEIRRQARRTLRAALEALPTLEPGEELTGFGCQVLPGGGGVDLSVRRIADGDEPHSDMWFRGRLNVEWPAWTSRYAALERFYFQAPGPSSKRGYVPIAGALRSILDTLAAEMARLAEEGTLKRHGFSESAALSVWTEDDENEDGYSRVARARRAYRRDAKVRARR